MIVVKEAKSSHAGGGHQEAAAGGSQQPVVQLLEKKKGFRIARAWAAQLIAHRSFSGLRKHCSGRRLLPFWAGGHAKLQSSCPDKLAGASGKQKRGKVKAHLPLQYGVVAGSCASSCSPDLIADCIEFLKRSNAVEQALPPNDCLPAHQS